MIAIGCALLTAIGFYFSIGLGEQWWLAWLASVPVLWLAFGETKRWQTLLAAFAGMLLGTTNLLPAYGGVMPLPVMALILCGPAMLFALAVLGAARVNRRLGSIAAMFAFAALWAALDFASAFSEGGGAVSTPAASQMGAPMLVQTAALVGFFGITFLLGFVAAGIAASLATRKPAPAAIAVAVFCANAAFGYVHMSAEAQSTIPVALISSNDAVGNIEKPDMVATFKAIDGYTTEIEKLRGRHVKLIVLPENIARVAPQWREQVKTKLASAAQDAGATTLVAGFNTPFDGAQRNVSFALTPKQSATYMKRRLVVGLETPFYIPGSGPVALANGTGLEICKDMDFHAMIRSDMTATKPELLAVPAWDFGRDDWSHARVAIMRSVENGVPMARTARDGLLTLNDRYGRVIASARSTGRFTTLVGDLPLDGRGGNTIYDRIGDAFAWLCIGMAIVLLCFSLAATTRAANKSPAIA